MDINKNLEDAEIFELSRSQIIELSKPDPETRSGLTGQAGLKRDFNVPADFVDGYNYGIDVSRWQKAIDWVAVAASGPAYAYIKATQGETYTDPKMMTNVTGAIDNAIPMGCYHFLAANTALQGQIDNFLRRYEPFHKVDNLPPCMDLEWDYNKLGVDRWADKSPNFITDKSLAWIDGVKKALGVDPIIYTNKAWFEERLGASNGALSNFTVWMSRYGAYSNDKPPMMQGYEWVVWQFTDQGTINGIHGPIDVNLSADDFAFKFDERVPEDLFEIPEQPMAQSELSNEELASLYDRLRATFGSLSDEQFDHLKVLFNTASPRDLKSLSGGSMVAPLTEIEVAKYFATARAVFGDGSLNQGQVDTLNFLVRSASPLAIRRRILGPGQTV